MRTQLVLGCLCVLGGMLVQLAYGYFYTIGNMGPYIIDYMNFHNKTINQNAIVWLTSVQISLEAIAMPLGGWMHRKFPIRVVMALSCLIHSGGIVLTYFTLNLGFVGVLFTYGALQGFGMGFGYAVTISAAALWFPKHRGLVVGMIVAGFGAGGMLFTPIQTRFINPNNLKVDNVTKRFTDLELLNRVPVSFLLVTGIIAAIELVGILILNDKPQKDKEICVVVEDKITPKLESGDFNNELPLKELNEDPNKETEVPTISCESSPLQAIRTLDFYLLWISFGLSVVPVISLSSLYKFVGRSFINDDLFLAGIGISASVFNSIGRIVWGLICDRTSFKTPLCLMLASWGILICTFPHLTVFSGVTAKTVYAIWVSAMFFCLSGVFVFAPTATHVLFGSTNMAVNYGLVYTAFILGSVLAAIVTNIPVHEGNWNYLFGCIGVVCFISLFCVIWIADQKAPKSLRFINIPVQFRIAWSRQPGCCCSCCFPCCRRIAGTESVSRLPHA